MRQLFLSSVPDQLKGGFERPIKKQREAKKKGKCRICRSLGPRAASPSPFFEQPLEILPSGPHQRLTIHAPESSEAKAPHAMPIFAFSEERLDPHAPLTHSFLIWLGYMIGANLLEVLLIKAAFEQTPLITGGALWLEWTGVACCCIALVSFLTLCVRHFGQA